MKIFKQVVLATHGLATGFVESFYRVSGFDALCGIRFQAPPRQPVTLAADR